MQVRVRFYVAAAASVMAVAPAPIGVRSAVVAAAAVRPPLRAATSPTTTTPATPNINAVPVSSTYETATRVISRDIGLSVALPNGRDLWLFGDTGIYRRSGSSAWDETGFIDGSTALEATYARGRVPRGGEIPSGRPARFIPVPTNVYLPDGSGRLCVTPNPTAAFSARWPTGAAVMPSNTAEVLVTYSSVCVTHPAKTKGAASRAVGWGYLLYNWRTHRIDRGPVDVFKPLSNGAGIGPSHTFGWPQFANGQLTLFASRCTAQFTACASGQVVSVTMPGTLAALDNPASYKLYALSTDGSSKWEPMSISVGRYPSGLRIIETTSIQGTYKIFSAPSVRAPWHLVGSGTLPSCTTLIGFCFALEGHPELSTSTSIFVSYKDPDSGPGGHVVISAVPD